MRWLWFAVKNVWRQRRRTLVTIAIAAVGTTALLLGGGFAQATYTALETAAALDSGHLILAHRDFFAADEESPMQHGLDDATAVRRRLEEDPRVRLALPRLQFSGLLSNGEKSAVFVGTGVDAAGELLVRGPFLKVMSGEVLDEQPSAKELPEIMVGQDLAHQLHATPGNTLTLLATTTEGSLNAQDVRVRGIYTVGVPELDKRIVMVHLATAQQLLLTQRISTLSIYLRDPHHTEALRSEVQRLFPDHALQTWRDQAFYYNAVKALYHRIFGLLGIIIVTLVLFSVSNTLGMAVMERTREIGTLRALGALPGQVVRGFVMEGAVIGATGAALGMALALFVSLTVNYVHLQMPPPPGRSVGYALYIALPVSLYGWTLLAMVTVSTLAAWVVSHKSAARSIVEALNHV